MKRGVIDDSVVVVGRMVSKATFGTAVAVEEVGPHDTPVSFLCKIGGPQTLHACSASLSSLILLQLHRCLAKPALTLLTITRFESWGNQRRKFKHTSCNLRVLEVEALCFILVYLILTPWFGHF